MDKISIIKKLQSWLAVSPEAFLFYYSNGPSFFHKNLQREVIFFVSKQLRYTLWNSFERRVDKFRTAVVRRADAFSYAQYTRAIRRQLSVFTIGTRRFDIFTEQPFFHFNPASRFCLFTAILPFTLIVAGRTEKNNSKIMQHNSAQTAAGETEAGIGCVSEKAEKAEKASGGRKRLKKVVRPVATAV